MFNNRAKSLIAIALGLCLMIAGFNYVTSEDNPLSELTDSLVENATNMSMFDENNPEAGFNSLDKLERDMQRSVDKIQEGLRPKNIMKKIIIKFEDIAEDIKDIFN